MLQVILLNHNDKYVPKGNGNLKEITLPPLNQAFKIGKYLIRH